VGKVKVDEEPGGVVTGFCLLIANLFVLSFPLPEERASVPPNGVGFKADAKVPLLGMLVDVTNGESPSIGVLGNPYRSSPEIEEDVLNAVAEELEFELSDEFNGLERELPIPLKVEDMVGKDIGSGLKLISCSSGVRSEYSPSLLRLCDVSLNKEGIEGVEDEPVVVISPVGARYIENLSCFSSSRFFNPFAGRLLP
jgi:hypothetical protein